MRDAAEAAETADGTKAKGRGRGKGRGKGKKGRGRGKAPGKVENNDVPEENKHEDNDKKENENKNEEDEVVAEVPKEPVVPNEPVPTVPQPKKRARTSKIDKKEGPTGSDLPKPCKKNKTQKGEATAEGSPEGNGTKAAKRKDKESDAKKTEGDGDAGGKKKRTRSSGGEAATFARRSPPKTDFGLAKWHALRSMFGDHIKPKLEHYSAHEDV